MAWDGSKQELQNGAARNICLQPLGCAPPAAQSLKRAMVRVLSGMLGPGMFS